jgi:CheY-like chemotaxis protein
MACKILVVEDDPFSRRNMVLFLKGAGHNVFEADTGEAAVGLMATHQFDAVISDFRLPGQVNGIDVLRHRDQIDPGKRLILVTAFSSDDVQSQAAALGAVYIEKPLSLRGLLAYL